MKDNHKLNVAILTCRQSAQRINYYNALGRLCKLTVIAERKTPDTVVEEYNIRTENYKVVYLNGIPMFGYMAFCPGVIKKLKEDLYDIIIVEQYATPTAILAISYMHRYKIPFIISADSGFPNRKENKLKYSFKKSIISKADFWITGGKGGAQYLEYYGADSDKTRIFKFSPYSHNDQPQHIPTYEEKKEKKIKLKMKESIVIISVGQQIHRKGFDILLRAVNDIGDDIGIYILGGAPNDECQEILEVMSGTKIYFPGKVSKDKLKEYYTAADIFVFPTRYDIWGYPVNEAMSYGLPIITTMQCNAGLELIERGVNGYLVEAENINELQKYILKLIENDKLRIQIGQNNYYKSKEYNSETMANSIYSILLEYREIYEQV